MKRVIQKTDEAISDEVHGPSKPFECCPCQKKFAMVSELENHIKTHDKAKEGEKPFNCSQCDKKFGTIREWENHSVTHALQPPKKYRYCSHCGMRLLETVWEDHELTCSRSPKSIELKGISGTIKKQYNCKQCDQKFASLENLKEHERTHKVTGKPLTNMQQILLKTAEKNDFSCETCKQTFRDKFHLDEHTCPSRTQTLRRLSNEIFRCEYYQCDREFNSQKNLEEHEKSSHICKYYEDSKCMFGSRGSNEKGQCKYGHPRLCIYFQTRGCKKGENCDFYHSGKGNSGYRERRERTNHAREFTATNFRPGNNDINGNRPNHSDARHVARDFQAGQGPSSNVDFLDHRIDRLEKMIHSLVQNNNNYCQGPKRW